MSLPALAAHGTGGEIEAHIGRAATSGLERFAMRLRRRDGAGRDVELVLRRVDGPEGPSLVCLCRDVTEWAVAQRRLERLTSLLRSITDINQMMAREVSEQRMLAAACRILVDRGQYRMAWVGLVDADSSQVRPVAEAGFGGEYLQVITVRSDESAFGGGPMGRAIRSGRPAIVGDTETDAGFEPWREHARRQGFRSVAGLPLRVAGGIVGAMTFYQDRPAAFDGEEMGLLEELVDGVGFSMQTLRANAERNRLEQALGESEGTLSALLGNLPGMVYRRAADAELTLIFVTAGCSALTGYEPDELVNNRRIAHSSFIHEADRGQVLPALRAALDQRRAYGLVYRIVAADGQVKWVADDGRAVLSASTGEPLYLEGLVTDITERRRDELALEASEHRYRILFDSANDAIVLTKDDRCTDCNRRTLEMFRCTREQFLNAAPAAFSPPEQPNGRESRQMGRERVEAALAGTPQFFEWVHQRFDGTLFDAEISINRIDVDGEAYLQAIVRDITDRKRAEQALKESEDRYRQLVELAQEGIWAIDKDGYTTFVNPRIAEMLGYTVAEMSGRHLFSFTDAAGIELARANMERRRHGIREHHDFELIAKDGSRVYTTMGTAPLLDDDGEYAGALATVVDVTERHRAETALRESEARLRTLVEHAPEAIIVLDVDSGQLADVNRNAVRLFGYSREQLGRIGGPAALSPPTQPGGRPSAELVAEYVRQALEGRTPVFEWVHRHAAGHDLICEVRLVRLPSAERRLVRGSVTDIGARKAVENAALRLGRILAYSAYEIYVFAADTFLFTDVNRGARENLGYSMDELTAMTPVDLKPEMDADRFRALVAPLRAGQDEVVTFNTVHQRKDGSRYPVEVRLQLSHQETPPVFVAMIQDTSERLRAEQRMARLSGAIEQTADSVIITDTSGVIEYVNPAFEAVTGYSSEEVLGQTTRLVKSGRHDLAFYQNMWRTILAGKVYRDVLVNRRKDGALYYEEKTITPQRDERGHIVSFISTGKDITERMQTQERLRYLAQHDVLTELPNRALFVDRLTQTLARARWHERPVAVLFLDLDRFKIINDTLGHDVGDQALRILGQRLAGCIRDGDTVARLGGDEFSFILEDIGSLDDIPAVAAKILEALSKPCVIGGREFFVSASIGISVFPDDGGDAQTLLKHADIAMYRAKQQGRNNYQFYTYDMNATAFERLAMETSLRHALEREEFVLYYQPQPDLRTGKLIAAEALIRWQHPDLGLVSPARFVPLLEETGLIVPVGEWVLRTACRQARQWHDRGFGFLRVAVNISAHQLADARLAETVCSALTDSGLAPALLELEITESALMEHAQCTIDTLDRLRGMGITFAIDDFGTGYSSLSYLRRFPIDTIKIDQSFVRDITTDADDATIVATILAMARSLNRYAVAEGVETQAQLGFLRDHGCDGIQGYLFSPPLPAGEFDELLQAPPCL